jgi:hypothetical protein
MIFCHAPPSSRVLYTRLENVQVRYHWREPADPMNVVLATIIGAEAVPQ